MAGMAGMAGKATMNRRARRRAEGAQPTQDPPLGAPYCAFGQKLLLVDRDGLVGELLRLAQCSKTCRFVANLNMNALHHLARSPDFRAAYSQAHASHIDGSPLVPILKAAGLPARMEHRNGYIDFVHPLLAGAAELGLGVATIGGRPEMQSDLRNRLVAQHSGLKLLTHHGYFDAEEENLELANKIQAFAPRVTIVGMGMPKQEVWIERNLTNMPPGLILNGGGVLELLAGERWIPPRWLGNFGLEWAARLARYPRFWRRYLLEPFPTLPSVLREIRALRANRGLAGSAQT